MGCEDWVIGGVVDWRNCGGLRRNIPKVEGRATQWLRGVGRRLRVDGDCVVSLADWPW